MTTTIDQPAPAEEQATGPRHRRTPVLEPLAKVALLGVAAGALSQWSVLPDVARLALLLAFVLSSPGSALVLWWQRLTRSSRNALAPVCGISLVVLLTVAEANAKFWHPVATLVVLSGTAVVSVAVRTALAGTTSDLVTPAETRPGTAWRARIRDAQTPTVGPYLVPGLLVLTGISWALCLPSIGHSATSQWGLLVAGGPWFLASVVLVGVTGIVAFARRTVPGLLATGLAVIVVERFTIAIAAPVSLYPWTAKHEAVVDYVDRFHFVTRGSDIYQNWPGLFTSMAWLHQLTGVSVAGLAHWFTPLYHLVLVPVVYAAARAWGRPPLVAAGAVLIFEACSFAAQDYFSPQALGYLLGIGVLVVLGESRQRRTASTLAIVIFTTLTITHQLTPYWLILVTVALVVLRRLRPWWLPIVFAGIAGSYLVLQYAAVSKYGGITSSSDPIQNARLSGHALPVFGIRTQFYAIVVMYLILFGSAAMVLLWRLLRTTREWRAPASFAFAPVLLLFGQGYGGEAIFRIFLYALPGLSAIAATLLLAAFARARWSALLAGAMVPASMLIAAHAYLGSYSAYKVSSTESDVWQAFNRDAPSRSFFYTLGPGFIGNPEWYYFSRDTALSTYARAFFSADTRVSSNFHSTAQYERFMELIFTSASATDAGGSDRPLYFALSDAEQNYAHLYGVLANGATANLRLHMLHDPRWKLVTDAGTSQLFRLAEQP